jgi:N-acylneuraminate cytidylyltransferase
MSGKVIHPCLIESKYSVDLDNSRDWQQAEASISSLKDDIVIPGTPFNAIRQETELLVLDFDGVLTDNRVYVNQHGEETIAAHRGDGMGISLVKKAGIEVIILTKERNPVVKARADKLDIPVYQGVDEKGAKLKEILKEKKLSREKVVYIGNDINDLPVTDLVGLVVAVQDSHPSFLEKADLVLSSNGGFGAVREFCDLLLEKLAKK